MLGKRQGPAPRRRTGTAGVSNSASAYFANAAFPVAFLARRHRDRRRRRQRRAASRPARSQERPARRPDRAQRHPGLGVAYSTRLPGPSSQCPRQRHELRWPTNPIISCSGWRATVGGLGRTDFVPRADLRPVPAGPARRRSPALGRPPPGGHGRRRRDPRAGRRCRNRYRRTRAASGSQGRAGDRPSPAVRRIPAPITAIPGATTRSKACRPTPRSC